MTEHEFMEKLAEESAKDRTEGLRWVAGGGIRLPITRTRSTDPSSYCPITYLAHRLYGESWDPVEYDEAATTLNIDEELAESIVKAADHADPAQLNAAQRRIRHQMLKATGLIGIIQS